jgi:ribosomal protein S3
MPDKYEFKGTVVLPDNVHERSTFVRAIEEAVQDATENVKNASGQTVQISGKIIRVVNRKPKAAVAGEDDKNE